MKDDRPIYFEESRSRRSGGGSQFAVTMLLVLIIVVGGGVGWVFLQTQRTQHDNHSRLSRIEQNQSLIKEALKITDENFSDIETARKKRLDVIDDEIRKLWGVSNDRNKKAIRALEAGVGSANKSINTLTEVQQQDQESIQQMANQLENLGAAIAELESAHASLTETQQQLANQLEDVATKKLLENIDKRIGSLESQRGNQNSRFVRLQEDINLLRTRLLSLESSIQVQSQTAPSR